jgi:transcription initiation factor IIE alpha subunit
MEKDNVRYILCIPEMQLDTERSKRKNSSTSLYDVLFELVGHTEPDAKEVTIHNVKKVIPAGVVALSELQMSKDLKCGRKTVSKIIKRLNDLGMVHTTKSPITSYHEIRCLMAWDIDGTIRLNPVRGNSVIII